MRMLNRQYFRDESSVSNRLKFDQAKISKAEKTQFVQLRWKWNTKSKSKHSGHINWSLRLMPTFENNRMSHAHRIYIMRSGGTSVVGWLQAWDFIVWQLKFNRFLHPNVQPQWIFWHLTRELSWEVTKIWHIFTK